MNRLLRVIHHILTVNPSLVVALEVPTEASVESYKFISEFVSTVPPNFDCSSNFDWSKKWVEIIASSSLWKNIFELRLCSLWPLAERGIILSYFIILRSSTICCFNYGKPF